MGRKTASGLIFSRGGYSLTTGDGDSDDRNIRYCSRLRCCASLSSLKNNQIGNAGRATKHIRASSNIGATSQFSSVCSLVNYHSDEQSQQKRTNSTRTTECNLRPISSGDEMVVTRHSGLESRVPQSFSRDEHGELETCSTQFTAPKKVIRQSRYDTPESSYTNTGLAVNHTAQSVGAGMGKYSCRNSPSGFPANSGFGTRPSAFQKRYSSGRSSLRRDKSISASPNPGLSVSVPYASEDIMSQQSSTRSKKQHHDMGLVHNITNLAPSREERMRQQEQVDTSSSLSENATSARLPENELGYASASSTGDEVGPAFVSSSGYSFALPRLFNRVRRPNGSSNTMQVSRTSSVNTDGNWNFSMEGVAQLLLALERIEPDEQTYEQELVLGNDWRLDTLSIIDQHRDMRMDIDNMTYEELLALGEKIGTVCTALTEEALSSCLVRSTFKPSCADPEIANLEEEEAKCSICQEEYVLGEVLGKLTCGHRYHVACIHQWFRLRNWCPICKAYVSRAC